MEERHHINKHNWVKCDGGGHGRGANALWGVQSGMVRNGFWEKGRWKVRCKRKERISQVNGYRRVVSALCEHTELHLRREGCTVSCGRGEQEERVRRRGLGCHSGGCELQWDSLPHPQTPGSDGQAWASGCLLPLSIQDMTVSSEHLPRYSVDSQCHHLLQTHCQVEVARMSPPLCWACLQWKKIVGNF